MLPLFVNNFISSPFISFKSLHVPCQSTESLGSLPGAVGFIHASSLESLTSYGLSTEASAAAVLSVSSDCIKQIQDMLLVAGASGTREGHVFGVPDF